MSVTDTAPAEGEPLIKQGHAARQNGDHPAALAAFQAAVEVDPGHPGARAGLASELQLMGRLDKAEALCRDALAVDPHHADALIQLGQIARQRGDRAAAFEAFRTAATAHPDRMDLKLETVSELRELGRLDEAEQFCHLRVYEQLYRVCSLTLNCRPGQRLPSTRAAVPGRRDRERPLRDSCIAENSKRGSVLRGSAFTEEDVGD
ncbi:MAG: tetratricopeptide repeat protein [Xanthobacteraceae bacterium]